MSLLGRDLVEPMAARSHQHLRVAEEATWVVAGERQWGETHSCVRPDARAVSYCVVPAAGKLSWLACGNGRAHAGMDPCETSRDACAVLVCGFALRVFAAGRQAIGVMLLEKDARTLLLQ